MQLPHVTDDSTRWEIVEEVIKENQSRFQELIDNKIDVRFFGFDNRVIPLESENGMVQLPEISRRGRNGYWISSVRNQSRRSRPAIAGSIPAE